MTEREKSAFGISACSASCRWLRAAPDRRCRRRHGIASAIAIGLGCDGMIVNTAIAEVKNPVMMARAIKLAVEAGRTAYLTGRMAKKLRRSVLAAGGTDLSRHISSPKGHSIRVQSVRNRCNQ